MAGEKKRRAKAPPVENTETMVPVRVPHSLRQRVKLLAVKEGRPMQETLTELLEEALKQHERGA